MKHRDQVQWSSSAEYNIWKRAQGPRRERGFDRKPTWPSAVY